jgi:tetratricopeptide (TPR) repeat protein
MNFEKLYSRDEVINNFSKNYFPDIDFSPMVYIRRAQALSERGYYQAITELEAATQLDPTLDGNKYMDLNDLGLILGRNEQYEAAIKCFKEAKELTEYIRTYPKNRS